MSEKLKAAFDALVGVWGNLSDEAKGAVRTTSAELADALDSVKAVVEEEAESVES